MRREIGEGHRASTPIAFGRHGAQHLRLELRRLDLNSFLEIGDSVYRLSILGEANRYRGVYFLPVEHTRDPRFDNEIFLDYRIAAARFVRLVVLLDIAGGL